MGIKLHQAPGLQLRWPTPDAAGGPRAQVQTPKLPYFPQFYFDHLDHGDVPQGPVVPSLLIGKLSTEIAIALEFRL